MREVSISASQIASLENLLTMYLFKMLCSSLYSRTIVQSTNLRSKLVAKHRAVDVLKRLHARQTDLKHISFEDLFAERVPQLLFRFADGYQPPSMNGTFRRLMRDTGLLKNTEGQTRTLYSLRHTYATFELLRQSTDIHTLSKQMGNSAAMIEKHYSKLTATMAADKLA